MAPKKNKKPSRNGYWEFVLETRDKQPNKNLNMQELQTYASRKWAAMSKSEKQPYEQRAQLARDSHNPAKLTTDGLEVDEVERYKKEQDLREQDMKTDINRTLKAAGFSGTLGEQVFLIIHINHLTHYPSEDKYFICEVAISAVSLKNGVEEVFHRIVKPGKLPLGFYGAALAHSKETHQLIDLVQDEPYENDTKKVFTEMIRFMKNHGKTSSVPVLYAEEKILEMTRKVIEDFRYEFNYDENIKVYNLQYMFYALRNEVAGTTVWPTETFGHTELNKDLYCYTPNIACEYHEITDISVYCSKSVVVRQSYTICDHCCTDLDIQLVPGAHVPSKAKVLTESRSTSKAPSVSSNDGFQVVRRRREVDTSNYEDNYPQLSQGTTGSSVVSFSSMKSGKNSSVANKAASRIEHSFKVASLNELKRDPKNWKLPEQGCKKREQ